ncbi:M48 family peptidase [Oxalobacteraceae bacterium OM1]|nr:M48 family peptidase [Oxalobacteraceae bacterium OM1]
MILECGYHSIVKRPTFPATAYLLARLGIRLVFAALFGGASALPPLPALAQNLPILGDADRETLSPALERKLGDEIMHNVRRDKDYLDDPPTLEYLNTFGTKLVEAHPEARGEAGFDFYFFAVRDPLLNAFALPGGYIGVHTALLLAAQNESELAGVLSHEIGHVAQRHIARMLGKQKQDSLIPLASMLLAALAARSSPDASMAMIMGGQGVTLQRQLNFGREAEREADRIGLQIMREAGYDTSGMVSFFGRMQSATRAYNDTAPAFLRSHPLTTERIADIQARLRDFPAQKHTDSIDFQFTRARVRVLQDPSAQGTREAVVALSEQANSKVPQLAVAAKYGLAFAALRQGDPGKAQSLLNDVRAAGYKDNVMVAGMAIDIRLAARDATEAVRLAQTARSSFPLSRGIARQYADALMAAGRHDDAVAYLRDQAQQYRNEPELQAQLARAYAGQGKQALQHLALAESYALSGSIPAALEQIAIARQAPDASYYDQAIIDARERELKARWRDEVKEGRKEF